MRVLYTGKPLWRSSQFTAGTYNLTVDKGSPRLSLSLPFDFACANIMCDKLKERKSLVWNHALGKNSIIEVEDSTQAARQADRQD